MQPACGRARADERAHRCLSYFPRRSISWKQELRGLLSRVTSNKAKPRRGASHSCGRSKDTRKQALSETPLTLPIPGCPHWTLSGALSRELSCLLLLHKWSQPYLPLTPPQPAFLLRGQIHRTASGHLVSGVVNEKQPSSQPWLSCHHPVSDFSTVIPSLHQSSPQISLFLFSPENKGC